MPGETTLIVTTRTGVRPLGVRGQPLHNAAPQLRRVVRRRLGDAAADLLAEPQVHEDGTAIDWYAGWPGEVRAVADFEPARRAAILAQVGVALADIRRLGETLVTAGSVDDIGVVGRSLQLAARHPADSFVFMVGDRPVVVCWGYEKEAAAGLLPVPLPRPPVHTPVVAPPPLPPLTPIRPALAAIPWGRTLAAALPLLLLLLAGAWLLREFLPAEPALALATREGPPAPPAAAADRNPLPVLKASLTAEQARGKAIQIEMAAIESELKKRIADCKPTEAPPKVTVAPPQVSVAPPPPPKAGPITTPPPIPPPRPRTPSDDRLRLPTAPTNNYSFMQGCWRTDPFRHESIQAQAGVSTYCFDAGGNGQLEWRRGRTACRTRALSRFEGSELRLRDYDTNCNDGSRWYADQLVCRRGADDVAQCSGSSRGTFGPVSWTVNLHKLH